jgi:hypothetical protein
MEVSAGGIVWRVIIVWNISNMEKLILMILGGF